MYRPYASSSADFRPFRDVQSQLRDLTQDFTTSFNTGNYDQAADMFSADGVLMAPHYDSAHGQKSVEQLLRRLGESGYSHLKMQTTRVDHSGDMAMELGQFSCVVRQEGSMVPVHGKYVRVWRRLGAWLLMADCWSGTQLAANERAA